MSKTQIKEETPLMRQYFQIKSKHPDALLLFRIGDFYELFGEDAIKASALLGITLTKRANGKASHVELAGFPHHSLDLYMPKLIKAGQRVAVCEQLEDPKKTKNIVKRGVTELITPGTSLNDKLLEHKQNNYLASVHIDKFNCGISLLDLSTGEFFVTEGNPAYIDKLLQSFSPTEVLLSKSSQNEFNSLFGNKFYTFPLDDWLFNFEFSSEKLLNHFKTANLKGFGIDTLKSGIIASGVVLYYLEENKHTKLDHINSINRLEQDKYVWLDKFTIRNLELLSTEQEDGIPLIRILDKTSSPMGGRMLRKWIALPLKEINPIKERQDIVEFFYKQTEEAEEIEDQICQTGDLERLISKVALQRINPREVNQIKKALICTEKIKGICGKTENEFLKQIAEQLNPCVTIKKKIEAELLEDVPLNTNKGNLIKEGVSAELDEYKKLARSGKSFLTKIRDEEAIKTGIQSLKIGFNSVFGYYLEVTNKYKNKVPAEWIRKQTLVGGERYITEELKEYEEKILGAEEKSIAMENEIYNQLVYRLCDYIQPIQQNASLIARLDCLLSFAKCAKENDYVRPEVNNSLIIDIKEGRHPVIEKMLPLDEPYIPNDIYLDNDTQQIVILTGPNMSGKSAVLRQTALIALMAQMGSYVPAKKADIGLLDKIFTRVGASDNLSQGESTFMVEMIETASILNNISARSLILLDEIGRGTSTYDGVSIAWAISEYLHQIHFKPKTLFATHYHELNELEKNHKRIKNFHVSIKELQNKVIFLRKLQPGGSEHSFGIHVAQMAGIPKQVVDRSNEILEMLEKQRNNIDNKSKNKTTTSPNIQLKLFEYEDPVAGKLKEELSKIDINSLSPIDALMKINHLKSFLNKK